MSERKTHTLSRREFLRRMSLGAAAGVGTWLLGDKARPVAASKAEQEETWGILIDISRCVGCNSCALACKESNDLPGSDQAPEALDAVTYTYVQPVPLVNGAGEAITRYVKRQCMHCLDAACVSACPAAAMYSSGEGPVVYRAARCLGCRYCGVGCPFSIPRFNWDDGLTPTINKCWMCYDRLVAGQQPACVAACPTGALHFDSRAKLLVHAHALIDSNPEGYVHHVYGESEVGGTSMLYLSDVPFEDLGFQTDLPLYAPPEETEKVMSALPFVIGGMATLMTGTALYTHRRPQEEGEE
jgi:formate dehydrogenase iron-sulfur subunit